MWSIFGRSERKSSTITPQHDRSRASSPPTTDPTRPVRRHDTAAMLAAAGIVVTDEGRERARAKLETARSG
jgi:hypothetical protein